MALHIVACLKYMGIVSLPSFAVSKRIHISRTWTVRSDGSLIDCRGREEGSLTPDGCVSTLIPGEEILGTGDCLRR
jgi:hypothetical protein